ERKLGRSELSRISVRVDAVQAGMAAVRAVAGGINIPSAKDQYAIAAFECLWHVGSRPLFQGDHTTANLLDRVDCPVGEFTDELRDPGSARRGAGNARDQDGGRW